MVSILRSKVPTASDVCAQYPTACSGKQVLITGASSGIGFEAALALARAGAHVTVGVRNPEKMQKMLDDHKASDVKMEILKLDLASFKSVRAFAETYKAAHTTTDYLILNAGAGSTTFHATEDGYESTFQACHLSHHLLARLLEYTLHEGSRVVVVASSAHQMGKTFDWPSATSKGFMSDEKSFNGMQQYAQNKLANMCFAHEYARLLAPKRVTVVAVHPGVVDSALWPKWMVGRAAYMLNVKQGASSMLYAALSSDVTVKPHLQYFEPGTLYGICDSSHAVSALAKDDGLALRLWEATETIVLGRDAVGMVHAFADNAGWSPVTRGKHVVHVPHAPKPARTSGAAE